MTSESAAADRAQAEQAENYIETYRIIAEWIRFADAKAGVTLTVNGILLGALLPTLKHYLGERAARLTEWWPALVVVLFVVWLGLLVISAICAFLCILPIRGKGRQMALSHATHFHPAAVSQQYPLTDLDRFVNDCDTAGTANLKREVLAAILIDSHLSGLKYRMVTRSIWLLAASAGFGFLYLLAIQF